MIYLLAQTYQEHMARGRFYERLGWALGVLSIVILVGGIYLSIMLDRKKKAKEQQNPPSDS